MRPAWARNQPNSWASSATLPNPSSSTTAKAPVIPPISRRRRWMAVKSRSSLSRIPPSTMPATPIARARGDESGGFAPDRRPHAGSRGSGPGGPGCRCARGAQRRVAVGPGGPPARRSRAGGNGGSQVPPAAAFSSHARLGVPHTLLLGGLLPSVAIARLGTARLGIAPHPEAPQAPPSRLALGRHLPRAPGNRLTQQRLDPARDHLAAI